MVGDMGSGVLGVMFPLAAAVGREGVEMIHGMHLLAFQVLCGNRLIVPELVAYGSGCHVVTGCCTAGWVWYTMNYLGIQSYTCYH